MKYESEKARLERIMSEFAADDAKESSDGEGVPRSIRTGVGKEELFIEGRGGERCPSDLQERFLRDTRQMIRDIMAERGETLTGLSRRVRIARGLMVSKHHVDMRLSTLWKIADAMGLRVEIEFVPKD